MSEVIFRPDGRTLAAADDRGMVRLFDTGLYRDPTYIICAHAGPLTAQEWDRYSPGEELPRLC